MFLSAHQSKLLNIASSTTGASEVCCDLINSKADKTCFKLEILPNAYHGFSPFFSELALSTFVLQNKI